MEGDGREADGRNQGQTMKKRTLYPNTCRTCEKPYMGRKLSVYCSKPCCSSEATLPLRFWSKVDRRGPDDCWEWRAFRAPNGYGKFGRAKGVNQYAHRVAWELSRATPPPDDMHVCHHCDHRACCNPDHLFLGTRQDNMDDMVRKGRQRHGVQRGEKNKNAKLTQSQVDAIRARYTSGETKGALALEHGVTRTAVHWIVIGKSWRAA